MKRRDLLFSLGTFGSGLILSSCALPNQNPYPAKANTNTKAETDSTPAKEEGKAEEDVSAVEDLMREHGLMRRALIIYSESAVKLREDSSKVSPEVLQKTAKLFRTFGEDYHEKRLEESFIFPALKNSVAEAKDVDILLAQHQRGREITDYIISTTKNAKINDSMQLSKALEAFVRMYEAHAAREDTIIFPAWKKTLTEKQLDEFGDKFEEIGEKELGENGFENALKQISEIETEAGIGDWAQFTPQMQFK